MRIRTFHARTMSEALELVKTELGQDAVILDSRKVRGSNGEDYFEVRAAIDTDNETFRTNSRPSTQPGPLLNLQDEINEIKNFLSLLVSTKDCFAQLHQHKALAEVYHHLIMQGLDEKKVYILLTKSVHLMGKEVHDKKVVVTTFCKQLMREIKTADPFENLPRTQNGLPAIYTFIGPTGVGKTTTLVKLATRLKMQSGFKVGVITLDAYRIGAYDQIRKYMEIIDLPLMTAQNRDELGFARRQMKECDLILVDTVGRNFLKETNVNELANYFTGMETVYNLLVLSASAKDMDLSRTIQLFGSLDIHGLIFTKLDETLNYGNIVNQLLRYPYPVTFFGTGQKIPEDIVKATKKNIVRLIFPVKRSNTSIWEN
ncbi:MAG TPA: hypothetical protein ENG14_06750 [Thermodesulforhabdus norvegica]|uniref:Flagellar biosynthesis protein FlhF n=1 Tax=Thermodesulforhabdus norvegica TaxID=39841 RepID=A0A7C0WSY2_9BACT|nr:hypothetical protein [Deltaproteobacteria bacterium]MBW2068326.1 hypothetical protein [Deltaproteobacteria bacterium]HDL90584.1 hypothetical protein [Thermodesulforhabdus norvegica]